MSKVRNLVQKLKEINEEMVEIGNEFVEHFPSSSSLYRFTNEISMAQQGLEALVQDLEESIQKAEGESSMKKDMLDQMQDNDLYDFLEDSGKNRLAEYLVQQQAPLASREDILAFTVKAISNLTPEQIVQNLSKDFIIRLGEARGADSEEGEFDAYETGVEEVKRLLDSEEERAKFIGILAKEYMKREPELAVRKYYSGVSL